LKTKITAVAVVLAVALAATAVGANLSGSARTIPMPVQGDPIPGVGVSVEQSPGGKKFTKKTDAKGVATFTGSNGAATFAGTPAGYIVVVVSWPGTSSNYNSSRSNTAGISLNGKLVGTIPFTKEKAGTLSIDLPQGRGSWTLEVKTLEGPDPKPTPKPRG
jgi:hypothetical protein